MLKELLPSPSSIPCNCNLWCWVNRAEKESIHITSCNKHDLTPWTVTEEEVEPLLDPRPPRILILTELDQSLLPRRRHFPLRKPWGTLHRRRHHHLTKTLSTCFPFLKDSLVLKACNPCKDCLQQKQARQWQQQASSVLTTPWIRWTRWDLFFSLQSFLAIKGTQAPRDKEDWEAVSLLLLAVSAFSIPKPTVNIVTRNFVTSISSKFTRPTNMESTQETILLPMPLLDPPSLMPTEIKTATAMVLRITVLTPTLVNSSQTLQTPPTITTTVATME